VLAACIHWVRAVKYLTNCVHAWSAALQRKSVLAVAPVHSLGKEATKPVPLAAGQPTVAVSPGTPDDVFRPSLNPPAPNPTNEQKEIILDSAVLNSCVGEADEILINYVGPIQSVAGSGCSDGTVALATASHAATNPFFGGPTVASAIAAKSPVVVSSTTANALVNPNKQAQGDTGLAVTAAPASFNMKPLHASGIGIGNQRAAPQVPRPTNTTNTSACSLPIIGQPVGDFNIRTLKSSPPRNLAPNALTPAKDPINTSHQLGT
ncbi:hypothetical protein LSAT2_026972, partial [Lamellibrachia satsuma]